MSNDRPQGAAAETPAKVSASTVDPEGIQAEDPENLAAALRYAATGWPVFALSATKMPLKLCGSCPPHGPSHDGETAFLTGHAAFVGLLGAGVALVAALLIWEHSIVRPGDLSRLDVAFFSLNGYVSIVFLAATVADIFFVRR